MFSTVLYAKTRPQSTSPEFGGDGDHAAELLRGDRSDTNPVAGRRIRGKRRSRPRGVSGPGGGTIGALCAAGGICDRRRSSGDGRATGRACERHVTESYLQGLGYMPHE